MGEFRQRRWQAVIVLAGLGLAACAAPSGDAGVAAATATAPQPSAASSAPTPVPQDSLVQTPAGTVASATVPSLPACTRAALATVAPGTLTIATGSAAEPPWFVGNDPAAGRGLEAAIAAAVADRLGFAPGQVRWTVVDRRDATAGHRTDFDIDIDQFTAPDAGTTTADYSTGYYSVTDSVLVPASSRAPSSVAEVRKLNPGVSRTAGASEALDAAVPPRRFDSDASAVSAVASGAVAAAVLTTPAALAAARANPGVHIAGQLPSDPTAQPDQFKALLPKGSGLTGCVSATIDRLRAEGTLDTLATTWVAPAAPPLR